MLLIPRTTQNTKKSELKPPDYDQFIQCSECRNVLSVYEAHFQSEIKDSLETTNNPFEGNESIFLNIDTNNKSKQNTCQDVRMYK